MPATTLTVGNAEITAILDVDTSIPFTAIFDESGDPPPGGPEGLAARYPNEFTPDAWLFRDHCFLVRIGSRLTLIDAGIGPAESAFGRWLDVAGVLPDELAALGVAPGDIDNVILTHVHSDHTGWSTERSSGTWVPRFPNARYHVHGADIEWMRGFTEDEEIREFAEVIAPLESAGRLDASVEDREVSPGLRVVHTPGHTPGHRCVLLDAGDERVLFAGDLLHFTFELHDPGFLAPGETDPKAASRARATWLDRTEAEGLTLATAHLPASPIGYIVRENGERQLRPR